MATDSCGPDNCPAGVTVPLECAPFLYLAGAAPALLSFDFPWGLRRRTPRLVLAVAATALATSAVPLLLTVSAERPLYLPRPDASRSGFFATKRGRWLLPGE